MVQTNQMNKKKTSPKMLEESNPVLSDQFVIEVLHLSMSAAAGQWGACF